MHWPAVTSTMIRLAPTLACLPLFFATTLAFPKSAGGLEVTSHIDRTSSDSVATAWYAGWHGADFPPENISWSKYTAVTYAFAFVVFSQVS